MYEEFTAVDRWSGESLHCVWKATVVAIATRHADATDIRFDINGRSAWIALPNDAWLKHKAETGHIITDYLAAQAAGRYLKTSIEGGDYTGRDIVTMSTHEVLTHVKAVMAEVGHTTRLPSLPVIDREAAALSH